jgi:hypothetical protein
VEASWAVLWLNPRWAPMLGDPKIGRSPQTRKLRRKTRDSRKSGRQGISESLYSPQKLWTPLHMRSRPLL